MRFKALLVSAFFAASLPYCDAKEYSIGAQQESSRIEAKILDAPTPEIPGEFQSEAFKSAVTARFQIGADARVAVQLLDSSGNEEIDRLVLNTLKKWKFQPATVDDEPVPSSRRLRVELEVE